MDQAHLKRNPSPDPGQLQKPRRAFSCNPNVRGRQTHALFCGSMFNVDVDAEGKEPGAIHSNCCTQYPKVYSHCLGPRNSVHRIWESCSMQVGHALITNAPSSSRIIAPLSFLRFPGYLPSFPRTPPPPTTM